MDIGHFYYINDAYFSDFPDPFLMSNKETINGQAHDRPCFPDVLAIEAALIANNK